MKYKKLVLDRLLDRYEKADPSLTGIPGDGHAENDKGDFPEYDIENTLIKRRSIALSGNWRIKAWSVLSG